MKFEYRILSDFEKVFCSETLNPEIPLEHGGDQIFDGVRGETIAFQLAFRCSDGIMLKVSSQSAFGELLTVREVQNVPCELPTIADDTYVLRSEPGIYPDPLCPMSDTLTLPRNLWRAVWVSIRIPEDFQPGNYDIDWSFDFYEHPGEPWKRELQIHEKCRVQIKVHPAVLPAQKLICTNWFYADCLAEFYGEEPWSERFWEILGNYFRDMAAHGRNMLFTPLWTVPLDTAIGTERPTCQLLEVTYEDGQYRFDFTRLKRWLDLGRSCGIEYFEMSHFFTQWGAKATPKIMVSEKGQLVRKFGWDVASTSTEYQSFLSALLPELTAFLRQEGLVGRCYFHISDEPSEKMIEEYKKASVPIHANLRDEEFPIIDALSSVRYFREGLVKRPVPWTLELDEFQQEPIEHRWCYFALAPNGAPARSYGAPSCRYRILGILLYLYDIEGFLHWGHNFWFSQYSLRTNLNPWFDTTAGHAHTGGHSYNVYPLPDGTPADAIHYEVFMAAIQDYRLLQLLEAKLGREKTVEFICDGLPARPTMTNYPREALWQWNLRKRILNALS